MQKMSACLCLLALGTGKGFPGNCANCRGLLTTQDVPKGQEGTQLGLEDLL